MIEQISVLYVDDEAALLDIAKLFLESAGPFTVDTSWSAMEALERLRDRRYDAIISDYQMPSMNGIELLRRIRTSGDMVPFILFTGRGREEVAIEALNSGADFYLQKGGDPRAQFTELTHKIRHATEKHRAELALRREEERFRAMAEQMVDALFTTDAKGTVTYISPSAYRIFGFRAEEMMGQPFVEFLPPAEVERAMLAFQGAIATGSPTSELELVMRRKDGKHFQGEINASPLRLGGSVIGTVGLARDISERKRAEERLRRTEADLLRITQNMSDLMIEVDRDGTCLFATPSHERVLGYSPDAFVGRPALLFVHPDDKEMLSSMLFALLHGSSVNQAEYRVLDKHGEVMWIHSVASVLRDHGGEITGAVIVSRDITDRKKVNDALRESEELLRRAEEIAGFGHWEIAMGTEEALESLGAMSIDGMGDVHTKEDFDRLILPEYGPFVNKAFAALVERGEPLDLVFKIRRKCDGQIRDVHSIAQFDEDRKRVFGVIQDITDRQRAEEALAEANRELSLLNIHMRLDLMEQVSEIEELASLLESEATPEAYTIAARRIQEAAARISSIIEETKRSGQVSEETRTWQRLHDLIQGAAVGMTKWEVRLVNDVSEDIMVLADPLTAKALSVLLENATGHEIGTTTVRFYDLIKDGWLVIRCQEDVAGATGDDVGAILASGRGRNDGSELALAKGMLAASGMNLKEVGGNGAEGWFEIAVPASSYRNQAFIDGEGGRR